MSVTKLSPRQVKNNQVTVTGSKTFAASDAYTFQNLQLSAASVLTVPGDVIEIEIGSTIELFNNSVFSCSVISDGTPTVDSVENNIYIPSKGVAILRKYAADAWILFGDIVGEVTFDTITAQWEEESRNWDDIG